MQPSCVLDTVSRCIGLKGKIFPKSLPIFAQVRPKQTRVTFGGSIHCSCCLKKIVLSNIPQISVFSYAKWDESRARLDDVRSTDLIQFDPNIVPLDDSFANFEFPEHELEAV